MSALLRKVVNRLLPEPERRPRTAELLEVFRRRLETGELYLPRIVHLETRSLCNGRCSFCLAAARNKARPDVSMPDALIDKVLAELAELGFSGRLSLYNNNEPFLEPRLNDIIARARKALPLAYVEAKSNGRALTLDKVLSAFDAGLDILYVNDYRPAEDFAAGRHRKNVAEIKEALEKSRRFRGHFQDGTWFKRVIISLDRQDAVKEARAGTAPNREAISEAISAPCLRPFEMLTIDPNGMVGICSNDVLMTETMGDLNHQSIREIWTSPQYAALRASLLDGDRSVKSTCRQCDHGGITMEVHAEHGLYA